MTQSLFQQTDTEWVDYQRNPAKSILWQGGSPVANVDEKDGLYIARYAKNGRMIEAKFPTHETAKTHVLNIYEK